MPEQLQIVTLACNGLHPDDIEELRRSLEGSRYGFKIAEKIHVENYHDSQGRLSVSNFAYTLGIQFSPRWFYGQTRQGGVKAVVKAVGEVLEKSSHTRDLRPTISIDSDGQEIIAMERWIRPRTEKRSQSWTRDHKIGVAGLVFTGIAAVAAVLVVPEFRRLAHLDKPQTAPQFQSEKPTPDAPSPAPAQSTEQPKTAAMPKQNLTPVRKAKTHTRGSDNVLGPAIRHRILSARTALVSPTQPEEAPPQVNLSGDSNRLSELLHSQPTPPLSPTLAIETSDDILEEIRGVLEKDRALTTMDGCSAGESVALRRVGDDISYYVCARQCYASWKIVNPKRLDFAGIEVSHPDGKPTLAMVAIPCLPATATTQDYGLCVTDQYGTFEASSECRKKNFKTDYLGRFYIIVHAENVDSVVRLWKKFSAEMK